MIRDAVDNDAGSGINKDNVAAIAHDHDDNNDDNGGDNVDNRKQLPILYPPTPLRLKILLIFLVHDSLLHFLSFSHQPKTSQF